MENYCKEIDDLNKKYQMEIGTKGHNIPRLLEKAKKKNDSNKIKEYENDIRIAYNLGTLVNKCNTNEKLSNDDYNIFIEGIDSWNKEFQYWTGKWYIKPFISKKSFNKQRDYTHNLIQIKNKLYDNLKKNKQ